jgi:hypothetical protein
MALTPAEHQRRYRERKKKGLKAAPELSSRYVRRPFFEFLGDDANWSEFDIPFRLMNIEPPEFADDEGPKYPSDIEDYEPPAVSQNSLGRAELMVDCLLGAATALAGMINRYKKEEIESEERRLNDLMQQATPEDGRRIVADLMQINRIARDLTKQVRWPLPQWQVRGGDEG